MKLNIRKVDGENVPTITAEFTSANIIEVEVGSTGHCGGDTGHGCRTYFRLKDLGSTDMSCKVVDTGFGDRSEQVEIMFGGDCELDTFINALEFALDTLRGQVEQR